MLSHHNPKRNLTQTIPCCSNRSLTLRFVAVSAIGTGISHGLPCTLASDNGLIQSVADGT